MLGADFLAAFRTRFPRVAADPALDSAITASATPARLDTGAAICRQGDACGALALVLEGSARVYTLAESGREITLYRVEPGHCCILTASCILSGRPFPANAVTETGLVAALVPPAQVVHWMTEHQAWRELLWGLLAERLADVIGLVEEVAFRRMDRRLAGYLVEHAPRSNNQVAATHQQIAAELGTSREVISRLLKDFELRGWLALSRGSVCVTNPDALDRLAGACD
jgi:CRP/FNR family transcriptional regulator